jgi:hypothetical protein
VLLLQYGAAWERVTSKPSIQRYHEKTGGAMTIDGSEDHLIQPQGTENYSFSEADLIDSKADDSAPNEAKDQAQDEKQADNAAPPAEAAEADGKDEKQADPEPEPADDDEEQQLAFYDTDNEDDVAEAENDSVSIATALPDGFSVDTKKPVLDGSLVGSQLLFRWDGFGWERFSVCQHYSPPRTKQGFNFELEHLDGSGFKRDCALSLDKYECNDSSPAGAWSIIRETMSCS